MFHTLSVFKKFLVVADKRPITERFAYAAALIKKIPREKRHVARETLRNWRISNDTVTAFGRAKRKKKVSCQLRNAKYSGVVVARVSPSLSATVNTVLFELDRRRLIYRLSARRPKTVRRPSEGYHSFVR